MQLLETPSSFPSEFARPNKSISNNVCFQERGRSDREGRSREAAKHPFYFGVLIAYSFLSLGQSALLVG